MSKDFISNYEHEVCSSYAALVQRIQHSGVHRVALLDGVLEILSKNCDKTLQNKTVIIGFNGAVTGRVKRSPPFFSFVGLSGKLGFPLLAFSDPSLALDDQLAIGWYLGNDKQPALHREIAIICDLLIDSYNCTIILAGGSAGGYAALRVHSLLRRKDKSMSFVWNPQTSVEHYYTKNRQRYVKTAWPLAFKESGCAPDSARFLKEYCDDQVHYHPQMKCLYLLNTRDTFHIEKHYRRFIQLSCQPDNPNHVFQQGNFVLHMGYWGEGHKPPPRTLIEQLLLQLIEAPVAKISAEFLRTLNFQYEGAALSLYSILVIDEHLDMLFLSSAVKAAVYNQQLLLSFPVLNFFLGYKASFEVLSKRGISLAKMKELASNQAVFEFKDELNFPLQVQITVVDFFKNKHIYHCRLSKKQCVTGTVGALAEL